MMLHEIFTEVINIDTLLFRQEQEKTIEKTFDCYENKEDPAAFNLVLIGVTGAGKTFTIKRILANHPNHIYISAATKKRTNQIISMISGVDIKTPNGILSETIAYLKKSKKVLIIDELNRLEDPKEFFGDLNTIFRETQIPIILITNNPFVTSKMEEDARNTLFLAKVVFTRYSVGELRGICLQRIKLLSPELQNKMEEGTLNYICGSAANLGSARRVLDRVRRCYQEDNFTVEHARKLDDQQECLDMLTFINSMNETEKKFLSIMTEIDEDSVARGNDFFTTNDIQERFPRHRSKIAQLVTRFEKDYNFIEIEYVSLGRAGGRYRKIRFIKEVSQTLKESGRII